MYLVAVTAGRLGAGPLRAAAPPVRTIPTVGIGGPVGSGKTALIEALVPRLMRAGRSPLVVTNDIFTQEEGGFVCKRRLPQADVGDFLVIENTGAYGFVMASNYNSKPLGAEDIRAFRAARRR